MTPAAVLVVGPAWVGDMVMAQALLKDLRTREPDVQIDIVAPPWSLPLIGRMPEVRTGIALAVGHGELGLRRRFTVGRKLAGGYRQAIVLPRSAKAALVPFFAGIPRRTGFRGELRYGLINDRRPFDRQRLDQTVKRFRALGLDRPDDELPPLERPALTVDAGGRTALRERLGLTADAPVVALMPGAEYGPAKQWPLAGFRTLAAELAARGRQVWVLGSERERPLGEAISTGLTGVFDLSGRTTLVEAVDLLSAARVAVSNDSGLMHVAAAVGTHVVGIYGSSSPRFTPPLTPRATIVCRGLSCSPCFERTCPLGHTDCLNGIDATEVLAAAEAAIA